MDVTNDQIFSRLGGLEAKVDYADRSRKVIHEKLDAQTEVQNQTVQRLQEVAFTLKVTTDVAVQARDKIDTFEAEFRENSKPAIEAAKLFQEEAAPILNTLKIVRNILLVLSGMGLITAGGLAAAVIYMGEAVKTAVRWYLGIGAPLPLS